MKDNRGIRAEGLNFCSFNQEMDIHIDPRRIYRGADKIVSVSKCKNWFCSLLNCVSIIFVLNIYVSDSTLSEDFRRAVSK